MKIDEYNLYDKLAINLWELADKNELFNNDTEFAYPYKFEEELNDQLYVTEKNLLWSVKEEQTYKSIEEKTFT